jgi:antitoxin (DNA-binding transcriptional repressor) of toxin-antitoxin stability system
MVVTNNGKPIALLTPLSDVDLEDNISAIRRARAIAAVSKMQRISTQRGTNSMTAEEIDREVAASREETVS